MKKYLLASGAAAGVLLLVGAGCAPQRASETPAPAEPPAVEQPAPAPEPAPAPTGEIDIDAIIESGDEEACKQLGADYLVEACIDEIRTQPGR